MERATRNLRPKPESGTNSASPSLDLMQASSEPPAKRRCISSACMPCRKRKSKCDGDQPSCNACLTVYKSSCYYDIDSDHRRKGALKRDIAQLKGEVSAQNMILDALKNGSDAEVDDIVNLVRANPDESYDAIAENIQRMRLSAKQKLENSRASYELEGALANFSAKPSTHETGDLTIYGHTSNFYYSRLEDGRAFNNGDQLGSWTTITSNTALFHHLLDLYFTWSHPFYLLFPEELFYHGLQDRKLKHCTPLLVNAALAVGCVYSNHPEALADPKDPNSRGAHFFAEARRLLYEDDRSCLTTVQALGLMSLRQAKLDHDSSGWQYASRMMGMAIELGLHMQPEPSMVATEIEARRITFWGAFILQTFWCIGVGRILCVPSASVRVDKPSLSQPLTNHLWKPHGLPGYDGSREDLHQPNHVHTVLAHHSLLAEISNDILYMFYAPQKRITSRELQHHHEKLQNWYRHLPDSLKINEKGPTTPLVFTLHMFYHNCVIQLFRPFLKVSFVQNVKSPRQICMESANRISQLLSRSISIYGTSLSVLMQGHCVMSAGIIHLVQISSTLGMVSPAVRAQSEISLVEAIRFLYAVQRTFPIMKRYLEALIGLTCQWCTVIPPGVQAAIADSEISSPPTNTQIPAHDDSTVNLAKNKWPVITKPPPNIPAPVQLVEGANSATYLVPLSTNSASPCMPGGLYQFQAQPVQSHPFHISRAASSSATLTPSYQERLFWTPFPERNGGVPLTMPEASHHRNGTSSNDMSVTGMLGGEFPELIQDGFTIEDHRIIVGRGGSGEAAPLWANWPSGYGS